MQCFLTFRILAVLALADVMVLTVLIAPIIGRGAKSKKSLHLHPLANHAQWIWIQAFSTWSFSGSYLICRLTVLGLGFGGSDVWSQGIGFVVCILGGDGVILVLGPWI